MNTEYVVLSDIHGNYPSLQAVVDKEGIDAEYVVLGDIHGLNAYPKETVALLKEIEPHVLLAGNHDKAIFHEGVGHVNSAKLSEFELSHTINSLSHDQIDWMQELDYMEVLTRSGERICLTHAYPWPEQASGYEAGNAGVQKRDVASVASVVSNDYDWVFHGHTHEQYEQDCSKFGHNVHFVSSGTLGYKGEYAVVDTDRATVELKKVDPQLDKVKKHIKRVLPEDCPDVERWL